MIDTLGVAVGVHHTNNGNTQLIGFLDGDALVIHVNHKQRIGQTVHVFDTTNGALELLHIAGAHQRFFLGQLVEGTVLALRFQLAVAADGDADGFVVGEHTAQPAMANVGHTRTLGLLFDGFLCSALGADKQDFFLLRRHLLHELQRLIKGGNSLLQIDDMNLIASTEDKTIHLRVPITGLVTKVDTSLQHFAHAYCRHVVSLSGSASIYPASQPTVNDVGTQVGVSVYV